MWNWKTKALIVAALQTTNVTASHGVEAANVGLVVVVSVNSNINELSYFELKRAYRGKALVDETGVPIRPVNWSTRSTTRHTFDWQLMGTSSLQTESHLLDEKIRGNANTPPSFPSKHEVIEYLYRVPNAIGYLPVDQPLPPNLREIRIGGVDSEEPGYLLRPVAPNACS